MASRPDAFQEFVLTFESPWNLAGETTHKWSQSYYVSGTVTHNEADAELAGLDLASTALALASLRTSLVGIAYYPTGSLISTQNFTYAPNAHPGTQAAYSATVTDPQQLEVCAVAHAPIGKNTRGKEIYLRKYFHDVYASGGDPNAINPLTPAFDGLVVLNHGAGPHDVVPCSPRSGATGTWVMETHLFTHQLRKGKKKKIAQSKSGLIATLIGYGLDAASAAALAVKLLGLGAAE